MTALMAYDIISEIVLRCIAVLTNSHHTLNFYHHQACDVHLPEPDPALCVWYSGRGRSEGLRAKGSRSTKLREGQICSEDPRSASIWTPCPEHLGEAWRSMAKHGEAWRSVKVWTEKHHENFDTISKYHENSRNIQKLQGPDRSAGYVWFGMNIGSLSWNLANYSWQPWQLFRKRHQGHQQTSHLMFAYSRDFGYFGSVLRSLIGVLLSGVVLSSFSPKWPYLIAAGLSGWAGVRGVVRDSSWDVKIKVDASWNQQSWSYSMDCLSCCSMFAESWGFASSNGLGLKKSFHPKRQCLEGNAARGRQYHVCMIPTSSPQATMSLCFVSAFSQLRCWSHCF